MAGRGTAMFSLISLSPQLSPLVCRKLIMRENNVYWLKRGKVITTIIEWIDAAENEVSWDCVFMDVISKDIISLGNVEQQPACCQNDTWKLISVGIPCEQERWVTHDPATHTATRALVTNNPGSLAYRKFLFTTITAHGSQDSHFVYTIDGFIMVKSLYYNHRVTQYMRMDGALVRDLGFLGPLMKLWITFYTTWHSFF